MARVKTTVRVVANAVRADGYEQAFGAMTKKDYNGKVYAACALGQAALNLHVDPYNLEAALRNVKGVDGTSLGNWIIALNDDAKWPLDKIADRIERDWADVLDEPVTIG